MHLSVSQIAWESGKDPVFLDLLSAADFSRVDIAPTKIWPDWTIGNPSPKDYRQMLAARGMACSGMQSLFFGRVGLNVFGDAAAWQAMQDHFTIVCNTAGELGVSAVVFGAPANRDPGDGAGDVTALALERFGVMGDIALRAQTCLCLEPVPADLGSRFLRTTEETANFVTTLAHPAVTMNLDTAVLVAEGWTTDETRALIARHKGVIGHVHASEPQLGPFTAPKGLHKDVAHALRNNGYAGGIAIEMRADADTGRARENLIAALSYVASAYRLA